MEHLVYCDTKAKVISKILDGSKTIIVRGAAGKKLPYGSFLQVKHCILYKTTVTVKY